MDETHEDSKYPPSYGLNQNYTQSQIVKYVDEDDDEVEEDDEEEQQEQEETNVGDNEINGSPKQNGNHGDNNNQFDDDDDDDDNEDEGEDLKSRNVNVNHQRHPKKRKLKSLLSSYEFAPRVPPPTMAPPKPSFGGRNTLTDWSEHETFVLLDAWGSRFLQCGRKSLRSEEWQEVAERVSQDSKIERTDSQCRNRLDTLKKKYKKEKASLTSGKIVNTKWVYFKKMDMLLSGEKDAFLNPSGGNVNPLNGNDDVRDSFGNSDSQEGDDDDSDLLPPKKMKSKSVGGNGGSFKLLAESINKFSEIYEKIENGKIKQMIELEKMRMDFHKDLEMQKRKILDRAQAEITKVREGGDYEENDGSGENVSG